MKIGVWCASTFVWRPSTRPTILYHVISGILTSYLPLINKIMFISRVGDVNGRVERNAKNFRFLAFRQILRAHQIASRCWKLLKIVQQSLHELKNMSIGPKVIIFDSGCWWHLILWNSVIQFMEGRKAGRCSLSIDQPFNYKNHFFLGYKMVCRSIERPCIAPPCTPKIAPPFAPPF